MGKNAPMVEYATLAKKKADKRMITVKIFLQFHFERSGNTLLFLAVSSSSVRLSFSVDSDRFWRGTVGDGRAAAIIGVSLSEPQHLMMSTAVCMSVVRSFVVRTYVRQTFA